MIRKRNGTQRILHNPDGVMRVVQYRALTKLLNFLVIPEYIYAFERNKSIPVMAALHTNKQVVISVDIKDFFHSIKQHLLQQTFITLGLGEKPARTLSEVCTYKAFVPQGALTSPKIANLITALTFGPRVKEYCDQNDLTLSIYADDITISSNNQNLSVSDVLTVVTNCITEAGFRVNREKTKVMWKTNRQYVCGVVVNSKTNMLRKERYRLRAIVHNITKYGLEVEASKTEVTPEKFASHIRGRLNWLKQLNSSLGDKYILKLKTYLEQAKQGITLEQISNYSLLLEEPTKVIPVVDTLPKELPF